MLNPAAPISSTDTPKAVLMKSQTAHTPLGTQAAHLSARTAGSGATESSYRQILQASALIGASSLLTIIIGIARTKAMAMLLGPSGIGLMSLYSSIASLGQSVAEMGINSSGVRQIAESAGSGDTQRIARTATVLRRSSVILGFLGALTLIMLADPVSRFTFDNDAQAGSVVALSLVIFFGCIAGAQGALIQGMRRIGDLAKMSVLGALFSLCISIPVVYLFRERGVVYALVGIAAAGVLTSWWFSRRIVVAKAVMTASQVGREAGALLKLGFAFMASALMMTGAAYLVRLILLREEGFETAGYFQAAWTLGGLYIGFILQAMGTDFYPRLTGIAADNAACNHLVNEQAQISLLLAGPGVLVTLVFAPLVLAVFYSQEFLAAVEMLRWICVGMALRVLSWPMGFIILAKGAQSLFFLAELAWTLSYLGLTWVCVKSFGAEGAGIAFFGSYTFQGLLLYAIVRKLSGFRWSAANRIIGLLFLLSITLVFAGFELLEPHLAYTLGAIIVTLSSIYSISTLAHLVGETAIPPPVARLLDLLKLMTPATARKSD